MLKKDFNIELSAKDTLTVVEMNRGDVLNFKLQNGKIRTLKLLQTDAYEVERVPWVFHHKTPGGLVYGFDCKVEIDGHQMTMTRYVGSQESFYEPYVINGMRIWFDGVQDIFNILNEDHGECKPHKKARFILQDMTLDICPERLKPWHRNDKNFIDMKDSYNGDDCWMGPYMGLNAHAGLDINVQKGDPVYAPMDFDDQWLVDSVGDANNNRCNRWAGVRKWENGDTWRLRVSHLLNYLVDEHTPIKAGKKYADGAGVWTWDFDHHHFGFKIRPKDAENYFTIDPWIIFWQIFENNKEDNGQIKALMKPLESGKTGQKINFSSQGCRKGKNGSNLKYCWTFGDSGCSNKQNPSYSYAKPGIYPVTLTVDDGQNLDSFTQHITIDGPVVEKPALVLTAPDEVTFRERPVNIMDVYGWRPRFVPHSLQFTGRKSRPKPNAKTIELKNLDSGTFNQMTEPKIKYLKGKDWIRIKTKGAGNAQSLDVSIDSSKLKPADYYALVDVNCPGALNSPQNFLVKLRVFNSAPASKEQPISIDDTDPEFYATPYFWVGQRSIRAKEKGWHGRYLTNGSRPKKGEFARFTPDLPKGIYKIRLKEQTPYRDNTEFDVRIKHKNGTDIVRVNPSESLDIGEFEFLEGPDNYIEILAENSKGLVIADSVEFRYKFLRLPWE